MYRYAQIALLLLCLFFVGCGDGNPATYPVEGQVRFEDGTVPRFGSIEFFNEELEVNARGKIDRDGKFTVCTYTDGDGAVEGNHKIVIIQLTSGALVTKSNTIVEHDHGKLIDSSYLDYRTSDLECNITRGENKVELTVRALKRQTEDGLPVH